MFLKHCDGSIFVKPLHFIFNKSLNIGYFPDFWKKFGGLHETGGPRFGHHIFRAIIISSVPIQYVENTK